MVKKNSRKNINWDSIGPILAATLTLGFYGGLSIWIELEESGGIAALFHDKGKLLAKILLAIAYCVR